MTNTYLEVLLVILCVWILVALYGVKAVLTEAKTPGPTRAPKV